ncbi:MAG: alanine dehydrogenase [Gammaproteobacteria bacterium]
MLIGVPREIKDRENRVALTPAGVAALVGDGHVVRVEHAAGVGSGYDDAQYLAAGATLGSAADAWATELVVKIKEPLASEYPRLGGQLLFTYLHLAGVDAALTTALLDSGTTAIAYETVEQADGSLPLLAPMSAVAGSMAVIMGGFYLARGQGGRGMLLGTVLGRSYGEVLVIGDGVVGRHAALAALGMGARVSVATRHLEREGALKSAVGEGLQVIQSGPDELAAAAARADLVVGAVLLKGARAPHVLTRAMVADMQPGSVIVDVSIDQGGCIETSRPTSHSDPVYTECEVLHYCVTNMPGAYPRTSTQALTTATLPYVRRLAAQGLDALRADAGFARGVNVHAGRVRCAAVAAALDLPCEPFV